MATDTVTDAFTDIVADITPEAHRWCRRCYPEGLRPGIKSICGLIMVGVVPPSDAPWCKDCDRDDVMMNHYRSHRGES